MHKYVEIERDISLVLKGIIVQGVNCQGAMGSGVAGALRRKYPQIYTSYKTICDSTQVSSTLLGNIDVVSINDQLHVVNAFTQDRFGADGKRYADSGAIQTALNKVFEFAKKVDEDIYIPRIGAGLGGLNWDTDVAPIVNTIACKGDPDGIRLYVCNYTP